MKDGENDDDDDDAVEQKEKATMDNATNNEFLS